MEEKKNIDDLFRSAIEPAEMTPPARAWNSLDAELSRKETLLYKKKANRFRLLSIGLILLLVSFVAYHYIDFSKKEDASIKISKDQKKLSYAANSPGSEIVSKGKILPVPSLQQNQSSTDSKKVQAIKNNKEVEKMQSEQFAHHHNPVGKRKDNQFAISQTANVPGISLENNKHTGKRSSSTSENNTTAEFGTVKIDSKSVTSSRGTVTREENPMNSNTVAFYEIVPTIKPLHAQLEQAGSETSLLVERNPIEQPSVPDWSSKKASFFSRLSVAAFYSPDYRDNYLKDTNPNDKEGSEEYKNREKQAYSFTTGILFRYDLTNRWSISPGISYSTLAYTMTFSTVYVKYGFDDKLHYQYPTSCGIVEVPNTGTRVLQDGDSAKIKVACSQLLKFINVPLTVRYHVAGHRLAWYADAGLTANFMIREELKMDFGTKTNDLANNVDGLKKMNFGYLLGFGLQYSFYKHFGIFAEPVFRGSITSLTENTGLDCYPYSLGLNGGATYHF